MVSPVTNTSLSINQSSLLNSTSSVLPITGVNQSAEAPTPLPVSGVTRPQGVQDIFLSRIRGTSSQAQTSSSSVSSRSALNGATETSSGASGGASSTVSSSTTTAQPSLVAAEPADTPLSRGGSTWSALSSREARRAARTPPSSSEDPPVVRRKEFVPKKNLESAHATGNGNGNGNVHVRQRRDLAAGSNTASAFDPAPYENNPNKIRRDIIQENKAAASARACVKNANQKLQERLKSSLATGYITVREGEEKTTCAKGTDYEVSFTLPNVAARKEELPWGQSPNQASHRAKEGAAGSYVNKDGGGSSKKLEPKIKQQWLKNADVRTKDGCERIKGALKTEKDNNGEVTSDYVDGLDCNKASSWPEFVFRVGAWIRSTSVYDWVAEAPRAITGTLASVAALAATLSLMFNIRNLVTLPWTIVKGVSGLLLAFGKRCKKACTPKKKSEDDKV